MLEERRSPTSRFQGEYRCLIVPIIMTLAVTRSWPVECIKDIRYYIQRLIMEYMRTSAPAERVFSLMKPLEEMTED